MKRIRFTKTVQYESEGRNKGPIFEEGSSHEFEDGFADRWLRRGVAVIDDGSAKAAAAAAEAEAATGDGLDAKNVNDLRKLAAAEKVELQPKDPKPVIIDKIRASRAAAKAEAEKVADDEALIAKAADLEIDGAEDRADLLAAEPAA